jgi:hypothetical protein
VSLLEALRLRLPGSAGVRPGLGWSLGEIAATDLPACEEARRFEERVIPGAAGTADRMVVCEKDTADAYAWQDKGDAALDGKYQPLDADLTTIAGLADPNADRILFWDDSAGAYAYLTASTGVSISGTDLTAPHTSTVRTNAARVGTGTATAVVATCNAGEVATGGGCSHNGASSLINWNVVTPTSTSYSCSIRNDTGGNITVTAHVVCLS